MTIKYVGSSAIGKFIRDAESAYPHARFQVDTQAESYGGGWACAEGSTDIGGIAGAVDPDLFKKGIRTFLIGRDDLAIIVHPDSPLTNLSASDLQKIFTGQITNWKETGGRRMKIRPFVPSTFSATRNVFRAAILGEADYEGVHTVAPDEEIIDRVAETPAGIGVIGYGFLSDVERVKPIAVNGETAGGGSLKYPIGRPLYLCTKGPPGGKVKDFIDWTLSDEGQRILMKRFVGAQVLTTVKPLPVAAKRPEGYLIAYTESTPSQEAGLFYYPRLPYDIFDDEGKLILHIPNHRSNYDENPTRVSLPPGKYLIRAGSLRAKKPEVIVTIEEGKTTTVNFEEMLKNLPKEGELIKSRLVEKIELHGDARVRLENDFNRDATTDTRTRARLRLRPGANMDLNEDLRLGVRLATGTLTDPNSPHETFTGAFDRKNFAVDRAFVQWSPKKLRPFTLWLGKFAHPFAIPSVYPELVWDLDVQPEGGAIGLTFKELGRLKSLQIVNGAYLLREQDPGDDSWMDAAQIAVTFKLSNTLELMVASGFYSYANVNAGAPGPNAIVRNDNAGNSATDTDGDGIADSFAANFRISDSFVNLTYAGLPMPLNFQGQYFHNFGSDAARDNGYSFGVAYGRLRDRWDWRVYYQYQLVQQDAVFSPFSQDDFLRQTNFKGHLFGVALAVCRNVDLHAWGLLDKLDSAGGGNLQSRLRLDLNVKF